MWLVNKTLLKMSKGVRGWITFIVVLKMVVLIGITQFARTISSLLGELYQPYMTKEQFNAAVVSALIASALTLIGELLIGEAEFRCTAKARTTLRSSIFSKILELDISDIEKIGASAAITAAADGVENMQIYYSRYLPGLFYCLIAPIYMFFCMKGFSLPAALMLLFVSVAIMPLNNIFRSIIERLKTDYWIKLRDFTAHYLENLNALTTIELFNRGGARLLSLKTKAEDFSRVIIEIMRINFLSFFASELMINGAIFAAVAIACLQLARGELDLGAAIAVLMLSFGFFGSVRKLMMASHSALQGISAAQNISDILDIKTGTDVRPAETIENAKNAIVLDRVSYAYAGRNAVLSGISMTFEKGQVTAIVGTSGCGKSTVASMLMRFYDPSAGMLSFNGRDYRSFQPEELRKKVIMVPQFVFIFSGTIEDNLRLGKPDAGEDELFEVLRMVKLLDWVNTLPEGLKADVGDAGGKLSGGQRQKIGIARALLSQAEYIIFDEATSSVDIRSENEIWECIGELEGKYTLIIISHRLSTISRADRIYVLSQGKVVEEGTHEQLMDLSGLYAKLVEEQSELEMQGIRRRENAELSR